MTNLARADAETLTFLTDLIRNARKAGADAADALMVEGRSLSVSYRLGATERLERSEGYDLGLRVFVGKQQAIVSSTDRSAGAVSELVHRAVAMARAAPEDSFAGIAKPNQIARNIPDLDLCDVGSPGTELEFAL